MVIMEENISDEREMENEWIEWSHHSNFRITLSNFHLIPKDIHLHSVFFPWRHKLQILLWYFSFIVGIWWCAATLCWNRHGPSNSPLPPICFEALWVVSNCLVRYRKKTRSVKVDLISCLKKKKSKQISTNLNPNKEKLGQLQFCLYMN